MELEVQAQHIGPSHKPSSSRVKPTILEEIWINLRHMFQSKIETQKEVKDHNRGGLSKGETKIWKRTRRKVKPEKSWTLASQRKKTFIFYELIILGVQLD